MRAPVATAIAIAVGLIVLLGYFLPLGPLTSIRSMLLDWAASLAGLAGLIAILNLAGVHWRKFRGSRGREVNSALLILAFAVTFLAGLLLGPNHPQIRNLISNVVVPVEGSLLAVAGVSLVLVAFRLFHRRRGLLAIAFVISALVFLVVSSGFLTGFADWPILGSLLAVLNRLPLAGARGILLGVALGSLVAGVRVLTGLHRPYGG